jgi:nondiscriminating glutamyl-tRNA synthetase
MVGDFVIMRSNGLPTYNFAAAIDDAEMNITHVIRGVEHLSNTVRQLLIYEALGMDSPRFAHIPLILGGDRTKLSKRHGAPNIRDFRERGYPPEALVNYLAFLGWSTTGESEILSIEELVSEFDLSRVSSSPSIFDEVKLDWVSAAHIRAGGPGRYLDDAVPFFPARMRERYGQGELELIFEIVSENLPCFSRIGEEASAFMPGPPKHGGEALDAMRGAGGLLYALEQKLSGLSDWSPEEIRKAVKETGGKTGARGRELFMPLRAAVTGTLHGPDLTSIIAMRGREDVVESIRSALEAVSRRED